MCTGILCHRGWPVDGKSRVTVRVTLVCRDTGGWVNGKSRDILGLSELLWCTGILCHWGWLVDGKSRDVPGLTELLWCTGIPYFLV